jgi:hypothetical protein
MKLVVIGKPKNHHLRVDKDIYEIWFYKHFVPEVWAFLKERITAESSVAARQGPFSSKRQHTDF